MPWPPRLPVACCLSVIVFGFAALVSLPQRTAPGSCEPGYDAATHTGQMTTREGQALVHRAPATFVENRGQWDFPARYVARLGPMTAFLEERGWMLSLEQRVGEPASGEAPEQNERRPRGRRPGNHDTAKKSRVGGVGLRMRFTGADVPEIVPEARLSGCHSYFLGNDPAKWRTDLPLHGAVRYLGLYPGVDLRCYERERRFEYDVELEPGADLASVEVVVEGAQGMRLAADGALVLETAVGPLRQLPPQTYEVDPDAGRVALGSRYELRGPDRFGFVVPGWSGERALVLDPGLVYSTFVGGGLGDAAYALAVDAAGVVTIAGRTVSPDYPTTPGAWDRTFSGGVGRHDVFVTRLDPSRSASQQLLYSTFVGGGYFDQATALAVDAAGIVTITGWTSSGDYPVTPGAWDTTHSGAQTDVFVTRLDPSQPASRQLLYSTFVGGAAPPGRNEPTALAVDAAGVVTITGWTSSGTYPTTPGAWNTTYNGGGSEAFVTRLDPSRPAAQQLLYSTFVGGGYTDQAFALAVDAAGVVTIAGRTDSPNYPTTLGAWDTTHNGSWDAFVTRLDPSRPAAQQLLYSTFVGADQTDETFALAVDAAGVVTIAGRTTSWTYPTTPGAWDRTYSGRQDVFVTRLDPSRPASQQLLYSTFVGTSRNDEEATALAVDAAGVVTIAGVTGSWDYPTTPGAWDTTWDGCNDVFVTRLDPSRPASQQLLYSTLVGASNCDWTSALAVDAAGVVTITGWTESPSYPTTPGAWDRTYGAGDAFVTRLDMLPAGVSPFGRSSPGCRGPLAISVTSMPRIGNASFALTCGNAPPNTIGFVGLAAAGLTTPIPVLGIELWVDPASAWLLSFGTQSNALGAADLAMPIPPSPGLIGLRMNAQFVWIGPSFPPPCPPLGLSASGALAITIQP